MHCLVPPRGLLKIGMGMSDMLHTPPLHPAMDLPFAIALDPPNDSGRNPTRHFTRVRAYQRPVTGRVSQQSTAPFHAESACTPRRLGMQLAGGDQYLCQARQVAVQLANIALPWTFDFSRFAQRYPARCCPTVTELPPFVGYPCS